MLSRSLHPLPMHAMPLASCRSCWHLEACDKALLSHGPKLVGNAGVCRKCSLAPSATRLGADDKVSMIIASVFVPLHPPPFQCWPLTGSECESDVQLSVADQTWLPSRPCGRGKRGRNQRMGWRDVLWLQVVDCHKPAKAAEYLSFVTYVENFLTAFKSYVILSRMKQLRAILKCLIDWGFQIVTFSVGGANQCVLTKVTFEIEYEK